jgi:WD40 repeat protein
MSDFDPYHKWLGIPPQEQPAHHYRLLGITDFEDDRDTISAAAEQRTIYLRTLQAGEHEVLVAQLLNEVSQARVCLLDGKSKSRYDTQLRSDLEPAPEQDPLAFAAEELAAISSRPTTRSRSLGGKPFWKEPWAIPAAAGGVVVLLLLMWLFSSGEEPKGSGQEQELQAEIALLKEKLVAAGNNKVDPAAREAAAKTSGPLELAAQAGTARAVAERAIILSAVTLRGHGLNVKTARFSPDGRSILSASIDKTLKLWDRKTGQLQRTFSGHAAYAESGRFSPDGKRMVSSSSDQTCKVWNVATGEEILTFTGHSSHVHSACFSPDGKRIVSGGGNAGKPGQIKVWDAQSGEEGLTMDGHSNRVWSVAFHPDGQLIVSGSEDRTVKIWNAQTSQLIRTLEGHSGTVNDVVFSSDGKRILSASADRTIMLWDAESGQLIRTFEGHTEIVGSVAFSLDARRLASGGDDGTVKIWDVNTGREILSLSGHEGPVSDVDFCPDGQQLVSGSSDKTIKLWDLGSAPEPATANTFPSSLQQGLIAYYPFNGNAQDESGNGNHGVIHGATASIDRFENPAHAYFFDGVKAFVDLGDRDVFDFGSSDFSLSFWFKSNGDQVNGYFMAKYNQPLLPAYGVGTTRDTHSYAFIGDGHVATTREVAGPLNLADSQWHHFVAAFDRDRTLSVLVDSRISGSIDISKERGDISNSVRLLIGKMNNTCFGGWIDDVRIYDRALSATEVKALYDFEKP